MRTSTAKTPAVTGHRELSREKAKGIMGGIPQRFLERIFETILEENKEIIQREILRRNSEWIPENSDRFSKNYREIFLKEIAEESKMTSAEKYTKKSLEESSRHPPNESEKYSKENRKKSDEKSLIDPGES